MAFDLSNLQKWTDETSQDLIYRSILGGNTISKGGITLVPNVKSSLDINIISSELVAENSTCGFSDLDTTTFEKLNLSVDAISIPRKFCLQDLEDKFIQLSIGAGSYNQELPVEGRFVAEQDQLVADLIERQIWQGNKQSGVGNLALSNGFLSIITASASGVIPKAIGTFSSTTAVDKVDEYITSLPDNLFGKEVKLFLSPANFQKYLTSSVKENLYHFAPNQDFTEGIKHRGSNVIVFPTFGLTGINNKMVLCEAKSLHVATDLMSDMDNFSSWFSNDDQALKWLIKYKLGTQIAWKDQLVYIS
jgi:hypothetical protein